MSRNILYIANSSFASLSGGGRTRVIGEARLDANSGNKVAVLCFVRPSDYQKFPNYLKSAKRRLESETRAKVCYIPRLPLTRFSSISKLNIQYCSAHIERVRKLLGAEIVHGQGTEPALLGLAAKKRFQKNFIVVADFHGAIVEEYKLAHQKPGMQDDPVLKRMIELELEVLRYSDSIIFVSNAMQNYYQSKGVISDRTKQIVIPMATNPYYADVRELRQKTRSLLGLQEKTVIAYIGSAVGYQLPDKMCKFFAELCLGKDNVFFLIISPYEDVFKYHLQENGVQPSSYKIISAEHPKVPGLLSTADFGLLFRSSSLVNWLASPTKFAEYCSVGVPVIATDAIGDMVEYINHYRLGMLLPHNEIRVNDFVLKKMEEIDIHREEYSSRCMNFVSDQFTWSAFQNEFEKTRTL